MELFRAQSTAEQLTGHLRSQILAGAFGERLPGIRQLIQSLGVNSRAVEAAIARLESEGFLEPTGPGKARRILRPEGVRFGMKLRVAILLYEKDDILANYILDIRNQLEQAGHVVAIAKKTLTEMRMDVRRIGRLVNETGADAWIVLAGSREVLEWFLSRPEPVFGLFGRIRQLPIAGIGLLKEPVLDEVLKRLVAIGRRRIVMLTREERRKPVPGALERHFLGRVEAHGIRIGGYNLPDWEDSPQGFHILMDSLFRLTPPDALLITGAPLFFAAQQHLAQRGITAPRDISMFCLDTDSAFTYADPPISRIGWDPRSCVRRVADWADRISRGEDDHRKRFFKAEFIAGGTIEP